MTADADLIKLYSKRILALAAATPLTQRLTAADGTAKRRSPLCGSTVTVDLTMTDGHVAGFGQDVKACALGQAAASIIGANIIGLSRSEIQTGRDQLYAMLTGDAAVPDAPFAEFEVLQPARDFKNRHASIMLVFEATLDAMDQAAKAKCA